MYQKSLRPTDQPYQSFEFEQPEEKSETAPVFLLFKIILCTSFLLSIGYIFQGGVQDWIHSYIERNYYKWMIKQLSQQDSNGEAIQFTKNQLRALKGVLAYCSQNRCAERPRIR